MANPSGTEKFPREKGMGCVIYIVKSEIYRTQHAWIYIAGYNLACYVLCH